MSRPSTRVRTGVAVVGLILVFGLAEPLRAQDAVTTELLRLEDAWGEAEMA